MIYTLTLNPSLDYFVSVNGFETGKTNRTVKEKMVPGGKGINVAEILANLGWEVTALGFAAGFVGEQISQALTQKKMKVDFIFLPEGCSRINIKLADIDGTEINGSGPRVSEEAVNTMLDRLNGIKEGDVLVLAGSLAKGMNTSFYKDVMEQLRNKGVMIVVDTTGKQLLETLPYHPFLIKPNRQELEELFDIKIRNVNEMIPYAMKLQKSGAQNVLISMGGNGALLLDADGLVHQLPAYGGKPVNTVGAGDSMVAGFIAGWLEKNDYNYAFQLGTAAGSATACGEDLAEKDEIMEIMKLIEEGNGADDNE